MQRVSKNTCNISGCRALCVLHFDLCRVHLNEQGNALRLEKIRQQEAERRREEKESQDKLSRQVAQRCRDQKEQECNPEETSAAATVTLDALKNVFDALCDLQPAQGEPLKRVRMQFQQLGLQLSRAQRANVAFQKGGMFHGEFSILAEEVYKEHAKHLVKS